MKLSDIENSIRQAFIAQNGIGPTIVTVADANAQKIKISFNIPSPQGVKTRNYELDESQFSQMIGAKVSGISFYDVLDAYQDSQTQSNDVATLREQAADTGAQQQLEATEVRSTDLAAESGHREIVEQNIEKSEGAQNSR